MFDQGRYPCASTFWVVLVLEKFYCRSCIGVQKFFLNWIFKVVSLQKYWFEFSPQGLNLKFSTSVGICDKESVIFVHAVEKPEIPENAVSFDILRYSNSFLLALPASFFLSKCQLIAFYLRRTFFPIIMEFVLYIRIGILVDQKWQSAIRIEILRYSHLSFSKTTHLKFLSWSKLTVIYFQIFIRWNIQCICPSLWNIEKLNMRKCPINLLNLSYFRLINIWSCRLELFRRGLYRDVLWQYWVYI